MVEGPQASLKTDRLKVLVGQALKGTDGGGGCSREDTVPLGLFFAMVTSQHLMSTLEESSTAFSF